MSNSEAIRNAVNSLSKASLAAAVAAASSAAAYSSTSVSGAAYSSAGYPAASSGPHHGSHISVINTTRQSNLITVPIQSEAGVALAGAEAGPNVPSVYTPQPVVVAGGAGGAAYTPYSPYATGAAAPAAPPPAVGYAPASGHFSQPPPSYPYAGSYASGAGAAAYAAPPGSPLLGRRTSLAASTSPFLPSSAILPITSLLPTSPLLSKRKRPRSPNPSYGRPRRILLQAMLRTLLDLDILFYLENIEFFTT